MKSPGELLNILKYLRPTNQNPWGVGPRHQYFLPKQVKVDSLPPPEGHKRQATCKAEFKREQRRNLVMYTAL